MKRVALVALLSLVVYLFGFHSKYAPYGYRNMFKPHRWATQACKESGVPLEKCTLPVQSRGELARFDFCLEHGEFRRMQ